MKAIVNTAPGRLEMRELPLPEPGPGRVRIRTAACGICATDLAMIDGWERTGFPSVPGHEWSGIIDAVGEGVGPELGGMPCVGENVLVEGGEVGFEHPGGYGEFFVTDAKNLHPLPEGCSLAAAALIEPLAVCVRAARRLRVEDSRAALVLGDGPVGLVMVMLLRREGVEDIVLVGGRPGRLALARKLGAGRALNHHEAGDDLAAAIRGAFGRAFPNVIEASGASAAMDASIELVSPGGRILVLGDYGEARAGFPWNRLLHREIELVGSNASAGAWPEAVRLAADEGLPLHRLVSHRLPASGFADAVALVRGRGPDVVKVVIEWPHALSSSECP